MTDAATANAAIATGRFIWAAGESSADMLYATGLQTPDAFLWFAVPGLTAALLSPLEVGRARKAVRPGVAVLAEQEFRERYGLESTVKLPPEAVLATLARQHGLDRWETPAATPCGLARKLAAAGLEVVPVDRFFPERQRKDVAEVARIRDGVALAELGLDRALAILREAVPGPDRILWWEGAALTAERLRGEIAAAIARAGGTAAHTIVAPGAQGADPHQAGEGPIRAHEPLVLDIFPRVDRTGYFGDLTRTVVKGEAAPVVRRAWAAVRQAQETALALVRAGAIPKEIHLAAKGVLDAAGFPTDLDANPPVGFFHGLGHGLGLEVHEAPRVNSTATEPLREGEVITVEPGTYDPAWGGIRLEDVVVVTAGGCEKLTRAPACLEIP